MRFPTASMRESMKRSKAQFFMRFGFRANEPEALAAALLELGKSNEVVSVVRSPYGVRYTVDGALRAPDGRTPKVRTVWLRTAETKGPRLITAHPL